MVVGRGYVGLALAVRAVEVGYDVVGYDVDDDRIKALAAGLVRRGHRRPGPAAALAAGRYRPSPASTTSTGSTSP